MNIYFLGDLNLYIKEQAYLCHTNNSTYIHSWKKIVILLVRCFLISCRKKNIYTYFAVNASKIPKENF